MTERACSKCGTTTDLRVMFEPPICRQCSRLEIIAYVMEDGFVDAEVDLEKRLCSRGDLHMPITRWSLSQTGSWITLSVQVIGPDNKPWQGRRSLHLARWETWPKPGTAYAVTLYTGDATSRAFWLRLHPSKAQKESER